MKGKKIDYTAVLSAVASGAGFQLAMESLARANDNISANYGKIKGSAGLALGAGLVYFAGNSEKMKAAGYAILGSGGASLGSMVGTQLAAAAGGGGVQGIVSDPIRLKRPQMAALLDAAREIKRKPVTRRGRDVVASIKRDLRGQRPGPPPRIINPRHATSNVTTWSGRRKHLY